MHTTLINYNFLYFQQKFNCLKYKIYQNTKHVIVFARIQRKRKPKNLITMFNLKVERDREKLFKSAIFLLDLCARDKSYLLYYIFVNACFVR